MHRTPERQYPDRVYASCWVFDSGGSGKHYIGLRALDGVTVKDILTVGVYGPVSTTMYSVRTSSQGWWATSVPRSVGWHEFGVEIRPFTGTDDVWFFIDGALAARGKRSVSWNINDLIIGAAGVVGGIDGFYDDVGFGLAE